MHVKVNGQPREVEEGSDIHSLLSAAKLTPDKVAVELNRRLIRAEKYDTRLKDGDEIEIVTFVGGGA
jgi:thiamine biosynthesis protein ThiS